MPRRARRDDRREREGPSRSRCRHRNRNPFSHAAQLDSRSLRPPPVLDRAVAKACRCRWPLFSRLHRLRFLFTMPPVELLPPSIRCTETFSSPAIASSSSSPSASRAVVDALAAHDAVAVALEHTRSLAAAAASAVAVPHGTPYRHPLSLLLPLCSLRKRRRYDIHATS